MDDHVSTVLEPLTGPLTPRGNFHVSLWPLLFPGQCQGLGTTLYGYWVHSAVPVLAGNCFSLNQVDGKWKSQSCPTPCNPSDCTLPGSSVCGDSPDKNTGASSWFPSPGDLPNPGIEPRSPALQANFYHLSHHGRPWMESQSEREKIQN